MRRTLTAIDRLAILTSHKEQCFWCLSPLTYSNTEVDHLIPQSLFSDQTRLEATLAGFGLDASFDVNSYSNLVPMCRRCNRDKSDAIYIKAPMMLTLLAKARSAGEVANTLAAEYKRQSLLEKSIAQITIAAETDRLTPELASQLQSILSSIAIALPHRTSTEHATPTTFDTELEFVRIGDRMGIANRSDNADGSWLCPTCHAPGIWQGTKCLACGKHSDPND